MKGDKPLISVLMAVYEPNLYWLRKQLLSIEAQTYPNLRLYIRDDGSSHVSFSDIQCCIRNTVVSIPYEIYRNNRNTGSNGTFEQLTAAAKGEYFAYCDQDDIWLPEKVETLYLEMLHTNALLVCSDMYIIDGSGRRVADSIRSVRRHHHFHSGTGLEEELLFRNFATGCTMLIRSEMAKEAIPFCPYMVHDHYLALWCAAHGNIQSIQKPLIEYRIHQLNQTKLLAGVSSKQSYGEIRIIRLQQRLKWLDKNFPCSLKLKKTLTDSIAWADARAENWRHEGGKRIIWKYRKFSLLPSLFELVAAEMPEPIFRFFIACGKRNLI